MYQAEINNQDCMMFCFRERGWGWDGLKKEVATIVTYSHTPYMLHIFIHISHLFYLTTGQKKKKKAFLRNFLILHGFMII